MSVFWLRAAAVLYSCGLIYALLVMFRKGARLFLPALVAFGAGVLLHLVSIVELRAELGHFPLSNFYETTSLCAFLIAVFFLAAYSYYRISLFAVCLFPLVFFMTLIGATEFPIATWSNPHVRNAWLLVHVASVLIGYAALVLASVAALAYLVQERQLKRKEPVPSNYRLPSLASLLCPTSFDNPSLFSGVLDSDLPCFPCLLVASTDLWKAFSVFYKYRCILIY